VKASTLSILNTEPKVDESMHLYAGMAVESADGERSELADIVVDPVRRRVTHLIVKRAGVFHGARLVPIDAVGSVNTDVVLSWTAQQILEADPIQETDHPQLGNWPHQQNGWDVGVVRVLEWPYHVSSGGPGYDWPNSSGLGDSPSDDGTRTTTEYDRIPEGTAEIRRASGIVSADGVLVGHLDGLILDPDHGISHIVLDRGHLWDHREITIPMSEVETMATDEVRLRVRSKEVGTFPSVRFHRH
jgi:uncharacterized protein YrrD